MQLLIKRMTLCCDGLCEEADVEVTDGFFSITCFAHFSSLQEGDVVNGLLDLFDAYDIERSVEDAYQVKKVPDKRWGYEFIGGLVDKATGIVRVGDILFDLSGCIPGYINEGEFLAFKSHRVGSGQLVLLKRP